MRKSGIVADGRRRLDAGEGKPPPSWIWRVLAILGIHKPDRRLF
jgi:hypothetical protein